MRIDVYTVDADKDDGHGYRGPCVVAATVVDGVPYYGTLTEEEGMTVSGAVAVLIANMAIHGAPLPGRLQR